MKDGRAVGACEYGIRSWCNTVGLDYDKGCEPVSRVLEGFRQRPQREVRLAVLHAFRYQARSAA